MQTQCHKCVMDWSAPEIVFDKDGCNFCAAARKEWESVGQMRPLLKKKVEEIKRGARGDYDCLIGLSGGVDSSYLITKAIELGLKPLAFSIDNGWNSPTADENILKIVEGCKIPFFKVILDRQSFIALQATFIAAGVKNIEIPTDHVLMALTYEIAEKYGIKTILSGGNVATESIMPPSWGYNARDLTHIQDIYRKHAHKELTGGLPVCSIWKWNYYRWIKKIKTVYLLDYMDYNRNSAVQTLADKFGYQEYGQKHCESLFTSWFQNYYLFEKFGIDKRKAHLSSLIVSGQMTRGEALEELKRPIYSPNIGLDYVVKKYKKREHSEYEMDKWYDRIAKIVRLIRVV